MIRKELIGDLRGPGSVLSRDLVGGDMIVFHI